MEGSEEELEVQNTYDGARGEEKVKELGFSVPKILVIFSVCGSFRALLNVWGNRRILPFSPFLVFMSELVIKLNTGRSNRRKEINACTWEHHNIMLRS